MTEVDTTPRASTFDDLAVRVPGAVLLSGIAGSTAYAMNTGDSDVDRLGVYAAPTAAFHGLDLPIDKAATVVFEKPDPDYQVHEARKFVKLAMTSNPAVTELLWLPASLYERRTPLGDALIAMRGFLATAHKVRKSYFGFAEQQLKKLATTGKYASKNRANAVKHGRHVMRILDQGLAFYTTGELVVPVEPKRRSFYFEMGEQLATQPELGAAILAQYETRFDEVHKSPLREHPDEDMAQAWLLRVRRYFWEYPAI